jgi:serine protease Do
MFTMHSARVGLKGIIVVLIMLLASACANGVDVANADEGPTAVQKAIALNEPAVVLFVGSYSAGFSMPKYNWGIDKNGNVWMNPGQGTAAWDVNTGWMGSGFVINSDGYIMTNAHVATNQLVKVLNYYDTCSSWADYWVSKGPEQGLVQGQVGSYINTCYDYLAKYGQFGNEVTRISVFLGLSSSAGPITEVVPAGMGADVKIAGSWDDKDVAIVKVVADYPMPTVELGDSDRVAPGDPLTLLGYPGISGQTLEAMLEPTATSGIVSALKEQPTGWKAIQTDATLHHGNSGGPAFDTNGKVIGLASWMGTSSGQVLSGINFLVPINIGKEFMAQMNLENKRSKLDEYWATGLGYFWEHHYSAAIEEFKKVSDLYPGHPFAARYTRLARAEIDAGNDVPLSSAGNMLYVAVGAVIVAAVAFYAYRRTKLRRTQVGPVPTPSVTPTAVNRYCQKCGAAIPSASDKFCPTCGAPSP